MSKRLRTKSKTNDTQRDAVGGDALPNASGAAAATQADEPTQKPTRLMLILWGIPFLLVVAALVIRSLR